MEPYGERNRNALDHYLSSGKILDSKYRRFQSFALQNSKHAVMKLLFYRAI